MRQIVRLALPVLLTACSTVLGIDGEFDDAPGTDAGSGASGGNAATGGTGGSSGASGAGGAGGAGSSGGAGGNAGGAAGVSGTGASGGSIQTGGTGAGGSTGGSGGTSGGTGEICNNGSDDDGDQKVDCADSECATSKCTPNVPSGWTGPALLWTGAPAATPPSCPGGTTPVVTNALDAPDADCTAVTCSCTVSGTCTTSATVTHYGAGSFCSGSVIKTTVLSNANCTGYVLSEPASGGVKVAFNTNDGQVCASQTTGSGTVPPATFSARLALCPIPGGAGGCTAGSCVTPTTSHPAVCIHRPGNQGCPTSYPKRTLAGQTVASDSRGCSPCKCTSPFCYPTVKDHPNATCGPSSSVYTTCNDAYEPAVLSRSLKLSIDPGSCGVSGGTTTGSVSLGGATTICCM